MNDFYFFSSHLTNEESASKHLREYCFELEVRCGELGGLECATQMCKLGDSTVSSTTSVTGWGYEAKSEADGFLLTIPQSGLVTWESADQRFHSKVGTTCLLDHRQVDFSRYSTNSKYVSIYLCYADVARYLTMLNGEFPISRVYFTQRVLEGWISYFLTNLANSILCLASNSSSSKGGVLERLKESLIFFVLYNVGNSYSATLNSPRNIDVPAPFCVKRTAEYIQANFDKPLTLGELAVLASVSVRGLQQGFKKFKNTTPMAYLRDVRLMKARAMLIDQSVEFLPKEIALRCGFSNYYLFVKYYSIMFNERPSDTIRSRAYRRYD